MVAFERKVNNCLNTKFGIFERYNDINKKTCTVIFEGNNLSKL